MARRGDVTFAIQWSQEVAFVEKAIDAAVPASPGVYQILQDRRYARYRGHTRILKIGKPTPACAPNFVTTSFGTRLPTASLALEPNRVSWYRSCPPLFRRRRSVKRRLSSFAISKTNSGMYRSSTLSGDILVGPIGTTEDSVSEGFNSGWSGRAGGQLVTPARQLAQVAQPQVARRRTDGG